MKVKIIGLMITLGLLSGLQSCDKPVNLDYLLEHPAVTKDEAAKCLDSQNTSEHCKRVMTAATKLMTTMDEQQRDPEAFGQRIINLEIEYAKSKENLKKLEADASTQPAQLKLARDTLHNLEVEMRMLLAVAGLSSPE